MNDYAKLMETIPVPAGLNDRVLLAPGRKKRRAFLLPAAVCGVLALALLATAALRSGRDQPEAAGLTPLSAANHTLVLPMEESDSLTLGEYCFTAEELGTFYNEDGTPVLSPVLSGETRETTAALYAATEESRFLTWPVAGSGTVSLSFPYGQRETPSGTVFHAGIDIPGERGMSVTAAGDGTVAETGFDPTLGHYLVLDHGAGLTTLYGQCQELLAAEGDIVKAGDTIALLGATGMATGPHLHFEVREEGQAQNPVAYFAREVRDGLKMG